MADIYELETADDLPEKYRAMVPPLSERQNLQVGAIARLCVFVNGARYIAPWVQIVEVVPGGYIGEVGGIMNSEDWHPYGTRVRFTADNVIGT